MDGNRSVYHGRGYNPGQDALQPGAGVRDPKSRRNGGGGPGEPGLPDPGYQYPGTGYRVDHTGDCDGERIRGKCGFSRSHYLKKFYLLIPFAINKAANLFIIFKMKLNYIQKNGMKIMQKKSMVRNGLMQQRKLERIFGWTRITA